VVNGATPTSGSVRLGELVINTLTGHILLHYSKDMNT
jgi:hypothetical protein